MRRVLSSLTSHSVCELVLTLPFSHPAVGWVDHSKTLREQGVDENETLLLRRKFFFSDQNIDGRDPVQLNLLYVQVRSRFSCRPGAVGTCECNGL